MAVGFGRWRPLWAGLIFLAAGLAAAAATRSWQFDDGTILRLTLPAEVVCKQISPASDQENMAFTLRFPEQAGASTISYQFLVTKSAPTTGWATPAQLDAFLVRSGKPSLASSVEKEVKPVHLSISNGVGAYVIFTDPDQVGKEITRPGVYRQMAMVACNVNGYNIFVRGYTNSTTEDYFTAMNKIIEGAEVITK